MNILIVDDEPNILRTTSIALTIIAAEQSSGASVLDRVIDAPDAPAEDAAPAPDLGEDLLPPSNDDAPLLPSGN